MMGQRIGTFQVVRLLGQGSRGAIYEAVHEPSGRRVALKLLRRRADSVTALPGTLRSLNGAWALAKVQHSGLVAVFDSGQLEGGTIYVAMEYLAGESLDQRLRRQHASFTEHRADPAADPLIDLMLPQALCLGQQIASILAAAHDKGITHHNLRPDKVMIIEDAAMPWGERVKVLDLGLAEMLARYDSGSSPRVPPGMPMPMPMGLPTYMAPEQCRGTGFVDEKADVYSLGVILYQMLAGHPPFVAQSRVEPDLPRDLNDHLKGDREDDQEEATSDAEMATLLRVALRMGEVMAMHMHTSPPPLRQVAPAVPQELAVLIHRLLAGKPEDRPSMLQVSTRLLDLGAPGDEDLQITMEFASAYPPWPGRPPGMNDKSDRTQAPAFL